MFCIENSMIKKIEFKLSPADAADAAQIHRAAAAQCEWKADDCVSVVRKRSIDARSMQPMILLLVEVYKDELPPAAPVSTVKNDWFYA